MAKKSIQILTLISQRPEEEEEEDKLHFIRSQRKWKLTVVDSLLLLAWNTQLNIDGDEVKTSQCGFTGDSSVIQLDSLPHKQIK